MTIADTAAAKELYRRAFAEECDEKLGAALVLLYLASFETAIFPTQVGWPEPPDAVLALNDGRRIAVEVTRMGYQKLAQVTAEAKKQGKVIVEIDPSLAENSKAAPETSSGRQKEKRTDDYRFIRKPDYFARKCKEKRKENDPPSSGWIAEEILQKTIDAILHAVIYKQRKLGKYQSDVDAAFLLLIDDFFPESVKDALNDAALLNEIQNACRASEDQNFDKVLLFRFSTGLNDLMDPARSMPLPA
jgi:hypothetical protein